jgi:hypothetical protein
MIARKYHRADIAAALFTPIKVAEQGAFRVNGHLGPPSS